jgi:hypothetical protein
MPLIRVTNTSGSAPTTNQLGIGDIVVNTYDGKAYIKKLVNNVQSIVELGTGGGGSSISASYATTASYASNGGVTQLIAGTNVTLSPAGGTGAVTVNAILASSGSGTPNGPLYSLQFNNGGLFSGSGNFTLIGNNALYLTGSLNVSGSITGSLFGTSSYATTALFLITPPSLIASQSITASVNSDVNTLFLIKSGSTEVLKVNSDKVLITFTQSTIPTPIAGGIFISSSGDFFFGI